MSLDAIQFTGKNSVEIAELARGEGFLAKAGGSYVDIYQHEESERYRLLKGDWLVSYPDGLTKLGSTTDDLLKKFFVQRVDRKKKG